MSVSLDDPRANWSPYCLDRTRQYGDRRLSDGARRIHFQYGDGNLGDLRQLLRRFHRQLAVSAKFLEHGPNETYLHANPGLSVTQNHCVEYERIQRRIRSPGGGYLRYFYDRF